MFCLHRNNCIYTVCMKLVQNVSNYIIHYSEHDFQVDLENLGFNLKFHAERILDKCR